MFLSHTSSETSLSLLVINFIITFMCLHSRVISATNMFNLLQEQTDLLSAGIEAFLRGFSEAHLDSIIHTSKSICDKRLIDLRKKAISVARTVTMTCCWIIASCLVALHLHHYNLICVNYKRHALFIIYIVLFIIGYVVYVRIHSSPLGIYSSETWCML